MLSVSSLKATLDYSTRISKHQNNITIPPIILDRYKFIILTGDIMKVNGWRFFISKSWCINFTTGEYITNANSSTLLNSILQVKLINMKRDFIVKNIFMDGQFQCLENHLSEEGITLNMCSKNEHVGEIERMIRTIKDRVRGIYATLDFIKIPGRLITELVYFCIFWLNAFHPGETIAVGMSPTPLVTGTTINYNPHYKYEFGTYVQTHEEHDNSMNTRTVGHLHFALLVTHKVVTIF